METTTMETLFQTIDRRGISIPLEIMKAYGLQEGAGVLLELRKDGINVIPAVVSVQEIENRALQYLLRHVGDAVVIMAPQRGATGDWLVPVLAGSTGEPLGGLRYTPAGKLVPERSTTAQVLRRDDNVA